MFYTYRAVPSTSARDLASALDGRRLRNIQALRRGDIVVCWGSRLNQVPNGVRVLNNVPIGNKLEDVRRLREAGVPTITISMERPAARIAQAAVAAQPARPAFDPAAERLEAIRRTFDQTFRGRRPTARQVQEFINAMNGLAGLVDQPVQPA